MTPVVQPERQRAPAATADTPIDDLLDAAPFTSTHRRVWLLGSMGIMLDGFDFFIMGVAIPLIKAQWQPSTLELGLISSAAILGAIVGAVTLGALTDRIGRQLAFKLDLGMFVVFALASAFAPSIAWLIVFRFLLGVGIGADYPISAAFVAEIAPARDRSRLLVGAFSFQAVGQLLGVFVGLIVLNVYPHLDAWRWMLAFGVIPALVIVWLRRKTPESPKWLASQGRLEECAEVLSAFCQRRVEVVEIGTAPRDQPEEEQVVAAAISVESVGTEVALATPGVLEPPLGAPPATRWRDLFGGRWRKATALTSVPWFLMDIATYGVGVFTPTIIAAILVTNSAAHSTQKDVATAITSTKGAAFVDLFLIVGFALAIWLIVKVGKVVLQITGFVAMAVGLCVLALASSLSTGGKGNIGLVLVGFAVFNIFMNMGPNSTTFVMPADVYETKVRAAGSGLAASAGKCGAALGALLFPTLQSGLGLPWTLALISGGCLIAAVVTFTLRREAKEPVGGWGVLLRRQVPLPAAS